MCGSVSSLFDTWWHTRSLCLLFGRGACTQCPRGGNLRALSFFYEKAPLSSVPLFEEGGAAVCFLRFRIHRCRGTEKNKIVEFAGGSGRWVRESFPFRVRRPGTRASCWIMMMQSLWHHLIQRLVLCWVMPRESRRCLRARKLRLSSLNPPVLRMKSCWRLWNAPRRGLTCFGSEPRWQPFSSRIHRFQLTSYANIERMPPIEETLASYLSMGETSSLNVPSVPSKPLQDTSRLNG